MFSRALIGWRLRLCFLPLISSSSDDLDGKWNRPTKAMRRALSFSGAACFTIFSIARENMVVPAPLKSILHHTNLAVRYCLQPLLQCTCLSKFPSLCASHSAFVILHIILPPSNAANHPSVVLSADCCSSRCFMRFCFIAQPVISGRAGSIRGALIVSR